jgi:hypothetical protein
MLLKEIIAVYIKNHKKNINTNVELLNGKAGGNYLYHWSLKVK